MKTVLTNRIDQTFARLGDEGRMGLFPYLTAGFPELEASEPLALAALAAGADGLELGVPFSDPLADGTTLQHASEIALSNGASLSWAIGLAGRLRARTDAPLILMTYFNPVHHYGVVRFVDDALAAGVDGVIVPDLPSGESTELADVAEPRGLYLIQMVAPTSTEARLAEVGRTARGFVYCVSLVGTTGARTTLSDRLPAFMDGVRSHVSQPLLIGFGIATPEHVRAVRPYANAVVVASALADLLDATPPGSRESALRSFVAEMRAACETARR